jgi:DNA-binding beta-propeller fold protein YncE
MAGSAKAVLGGAVGRTKQLVLWLAVSLAWQAMPALADSVVVLNSEEATFSVVNRLTMTETGRVPVGREPHHLMLTPDRNELVIASTVTNELLFLDPKTLQERRRVRNILDPYQIGYSDDGQWFVTAALRMNHIDIYRAKDYGLLRRIGVSSLPSHVMIDRASKVAYISLQGTDRLMAIELATQNVLWEVEVGETPAGVYVTPDNRHILVGLTGDDYVAVVDAAKGKLVNRIVTGKGAHAFVGRGDDRHVFVSNRVEGSIATVDLSTMSVVDKIRVGGGPDCMDVSGDRKQLWVTNRWARSVSVIDLDTKGILGRIKVGKSPHGVYVYGSTLSNAR